MLESSKSEDFTFKVINPASFYTSHYNHCFSFQPWTNADEKS